MELDHRRPISHLRRIKESLASLVAQSIPTPEFQYFISQLNAGFEKDHPFYGVPTGGFLNTEGTYRLDKDGSESGWYEIHPEDSPSFYAYQVLKSPDGDFSIGESFGVDPRMKNAG